jgi:acetolactate synthase-1/2/3 large subunit
MNDIGGGLLFARALKAEGIEQIFTLPGGHIMPIYYGCRAEGIQIITMRHECSAAFAADAYARVSGKPGVLVTTAGPGVTNTVSGMVEALYQGVPLIHIGGAAPTEENDSASLQDINTLEIMSTVSKWSRKIYHTRRIPEYVAMAFRHAESGTPGPVYLEIGLDVLSAQVQDGDVIFPKAYRTEAQPFGEQDLIDRAADLLIEAQKPMILIGDGARFSDRYGEAISELADYLKIPAAAQALSRGLFADETKNPLFNLEGALPAADVILSLCVLNDWRLNKLQPPAFRANVRMIQVNPDADHIGLNYPAEIGIVGGAGAVARQILMAVKTKITRRADTGWVNEATQVALQNAQPWLEGFLSDQVPVHPGRCAFEIARFIEQEGYDWTVICDGGEASDWVRNAVRAHRPGQVLSYSTAGTIGFGPGFSMGAWAANGKPVLYYTGDGSLGFYLGEFDTLCRYDVPVVCVISNDSAWGMIKLIEAMRNSKEVEQGHVGVDLYDLRAYERLVELWDGYGERITNPEEIIPAIRRAAASHKPAILNVEVDHISITPSSRAIGVS